MNYSFKNKTYFAKPKDNPKDLVELEIGDSKTPDKFIPQQKIMRWDNEVNVSIRLVEDADEQKETPTIIEEGGKIKHIKTKRECHFYNLGVSAEHPEDASEFEIILKEKPKKNVIEFSLVDKDVDYFYQPDLTPEEIAEGAIRPENVEGSYAIYAKTPKTNWTGGKEYKCGKVGHIFRPKIIDSVGTEVWGELHIENGILSVTIPQDFLDKAAYPVRHAAGLTFGYDTAGTTNSNNTSNFIGSLFTGVAGTGVSMSFSVQKVGGAGSVTWQSNVYIKSNSNLLTNGVTIEGSGTGTIAKGWKTANFTSAPTFSAVDYILVLWSNPGGTWPLYLWYDNGSANQGHMDNAGASYKTWPNPGTFVSFNSFKYSIYATYTAGGGATVNPNHLMNLMGCGN